VAGDRGIRRVNLDRRRDPSKCDFIGSTEKAIQFSGIFDTKVLVSIANKQDKLDCSRMRAE
jgi:hypothetical protein